MYYISWYISSMKCRPNPDPNPIRNPNPESFHRVESRVTRNSTRWFCSLVWGPPAGFKDRGPVGVLGLRPQKQDIHTQFFCLKHFKAVQNTDLISHFTAGSFRSLLTPKNVLNFCESQDLRWPKLGAHPWLRYCAGYWMLNSCQHDTFLHHIQRNVLVNFECTMMLNNSLARAIRLIQMHLNADDLG